MIERRHVLFMAVVLILLILVGDAVTALASERAPVVLPGQNACDGVLRTYGRCEQNLNGNSVTIPTGGTINFQVNFTTPFNNFPYVTFEPLNNPFLGLGQSNDVMLAENGTRSGGVCIGCTTYIFPAANTIGVLPSSSGYISIHGGFDFVGGQFPQTPTWATLNINVVSVSNLTSNGRNLWVQGFDPDSHADLTCVGQWESFGTLTNRPGLTLNNAAPLFNWGVSFFHGDRGNIGGVVDTAVPTPINQTILTDSSNSYPTCQTNGDVMLRVVGSITSGHETITYSTVYVTFYYPTVSGGISLVNIATTSFTVMVNGPPALTVSFNWKAYSESG